jgi:uncharacterized membrane protein
MKITEIPLKATVYCRNTLAGESAGVIVDPKTLRVTRFVVKESTGTQRLVSVDQVDQVSHNQIRLSCTTAELAKMQPFVVAGYRQVEVPRRYGYYTGGQAFYSPESEMYAAQREAIPWWEVAVHPGDAVRATDGRVGRLSRLVADEGGQITHLALVEGHLWGKREVLVPLSMVGHVERESVYLTIDKETLGALLAMPVKQHYGVSELELLVHILDRAERGEQALEALRDLAKRESVSILSAALVTKDLEGKTSLREMDDVDARHGALFGAVTGGLLGLLGGPVGAVVGAAAGAATGRAAAKRIDTGFPDEFLERAQERLQPGTAAVIALVEHQEAEVVAGALAEFEGEVLHLALTDDQLVRLATEAEPDEA